MDRALVLVCTVLAATPATILFLITIFIGVGTDEALDILGLVINTLIALGTFSAVYIAWKGLGTWKAAEQYKISLKQSQKIFKTLNTIKARLNIPQQDICSSARIWEKSNRREKEPHQLYQLLDTIIKTLDQNREELRTIINLAYDIETTFQSHVAITPLTEDLDKSKELRDKIIELASITENFAVEYSDDLRVKSWEQNIANYKKTKDNAIKTIHELEKKIKNNIIEN